MHEALDGIVVRHCDTLRTCVDDIGISLKQCFEFPSLYLAVLTEEERIVHQLKDSSGSIGFQDNKCFGYKA